MITSIIIYPQLRFNGYVFCLVFDEIKILTNATIRMRTTYVRKRQHVVVDLVTTVIQPILDDHYVYETEEKRTMVMFVSLGN